MGTMNNFNFSIHGVQQEIKNFKTLNEEIQQANGNLDDTPYYLKRTIDQAKEFKNVFSDANNFTNTTNINFKVISDTIPKINKLHKETNNLLDKQKKKEKEILDIEIQRQNAKREKDYKHQKEREVRGNIIERGTGYIPYVGTGKDILDTGGDFIDTKVPEGFTSLFDPTGKRKFFANSQAREYNTEEIIKRRNQIVQWRKEGKELQALYMEIELKELDELERIAENRRTELDIIEKELEPKGLAKFLGRTKPIGLDRFIKENRDKDVNKKYDRDIERVKENTLEEYYNRGLMISPSNDMIIEGISSSKKQTTKAPVKQNQEREKEDPEKKLRELREQSNIELDEQEFFQKRSLLSTESFNDRKDELLGDAQKSLSAFADATKSTNEAIIESTDTTAVSFEEKWKGIHETLQKHVDIIMTGANAIFSGMNAILSYELEGAKEKHNAITEKYNEVVEQRQESTNKLNELEEQAKNARGGRSLILQEQIDKEMAKNKQLAQQEAHLAREKEKAEKEAAKKEKQMKKTELSQQIIQGVANTASGVTRTLGAYPWPINIALAALVGAQGAIQIGIMTKQLAKLEDGGLLINGKRHSQGGMRIEGTNIEVEGGEYVVNRESTRKNLGLVRYINSQRKELTATDINGFFAKASQGYEPPFRRQFETGGRLTPPIIDIPHQTMSNEDLLEAIKAINMKVAVTDIMRVQEEMTHVDGWSGI